MERLRNPFLLSPHPYTV